MTAKSSRKKTPFIIEPLNWKAPVQNSVKADAPPAETERASVKTDSDE